MGENQNISLEHERLAIEKSRLLIEQNFWKKYFTPLVSLVGILIASVFGVTEVWVASIQKDKELETTNMQKENELQLVRLSHDRQWKLDMAKFVFENREAIFSENNSRDQERIVKVIAITFPPDISTILFDRIKEAIPDNQKKTVEEGQKIVDEITIKDAQQKLYYIIAMTSGDSDDIDSEIKRIKSNVGETFDELFPDLKTYSPQGALSTLLISSKPQPYKQAQMLKESAIKHGFSPETWLWNSNVGYFKK